MDRKHSNRAVNNAGKVLKDSLASEDELHEAHTIIAEWRALHSYPLGLVASTLRSRAHQLDDGALVARRLKRFTSIKRKLNERDAMALTTMQDIAGCRVVLKKVDQVYQLFNVYASYAQRHPHRGPELVEHRTKDYILSPKEDGYRSLHLVLRFRAGRPASQVYDGLWIEIQLRSRLQHLWAMAVETADAITAQRLKSGIGREHWASFFRLMSSAIAMEENLPLVPYTDESNVYKRLRSVTEELGIVSLFKGMGKALKYDWSSSVGPTGFVLLVFNSEKNTIGGRVFTPKENHLAHETYADIVPRVNSWTVNSP